MMKTEEEYIAGVEGGGSTWVCALAKKDDPTRIVERAVYETSDDPEETLSKVAKWLEGRSFQSLGIASFGPIDPDLNSSKYGYITKTPKPGWENTNVVGRLMRGLPATLPVRFDTDVNAPAFAEYMKSNESGSKISSVAYVTVGTGVGVGLVVNGQPVHGLLHPEAGHISVPRLSGDDMDDSDFSMLNCQNWTEVESAVASRALVRRTGLDSALQLKTLLDDHPVWDIAAHYLAAMVANLILVVSPQKIIMSGGIMQRLSLFPKIRTRAFTYLNGYIPPLKENSLDSLVIPSRWKNDAGIIGALYLARTALDDANKQNGSLLSSLPNPGTTIFLLFIGGSIGALLAMRRSSPGL